MLLEEKLKEMEKTRRLERADEFITQAMRDIEEAEEMYRKGGDNESAAMCVKARSELWMRRR